MPMVRTSAVGIGRPEECTDKQNPSLQALSLQSGRQFLPSQQRQPAYPGGWHTCEAECTSGLFEQAPVCMAATVGIRSKHAGHAPPRAEVVLMRFLDIPTFRSIDRRCRAGLRSVRAILNSNTRRQRRAHGMHVESNATPTGVSCIFPAYR